MSLCLLTLCGLMTFTLINTSTNVNLAYIVQFYGRDLQSTQWIMHIESLFSTCTSAISNQIIAKFGIKAMVIFSLTITCIMNLLSGLFAKSFTWLLVIRAVSAISSSFLIVTGLPIISKYCDPKKLNRAIQIQSLGIPFGSILASVLGGLFAQYLQWYYMYFLACAIQLFGLIYCIIRLPSMGRNKEQKINFPLSGLLLVSIALLIFSVTSLSQSKLFPWYVFVICFPIGVGLLVIFFILNKKSNNKLFHQELFNNATIKSYICYSCSICSMMADRSYQSIVWVQRFGFNSITNSLLICLTKVAQIPSALLVQYMLKKCTYKWNVQFTLFTAIPMDILNAFVISFLFEWQKYAGAVLLEILNLVQCVTFLQHLTTMQQMAVSCTPQEFQQNAVTFITLISTFSQAFGMAISICFSTLMGKFDLDKWDCVSSAYCFTALFAIIGLFVSIHYGVFNWERGKHGFKEKWFQRTQTFQKYLTNNDNQYVEVNKIDTSKLDAQSDEIKRKQVGIIVY